MLLDEQCSKAYLKHREATISSTMKYRFLFNEKCAGRRARTCGQIPFQKLPASTGHIKGRVEVTE
jgi:hypothetical protein